MPRKTRPGPKPGAPNAGRPKGTAKPEARRITIACRVAPATAEKLTRLAAQHGNTGRALDAIFEDNDTL